MSKLMGLLLQIEEAMDTAKALKASHEVEPCEPPSHVYGRNMALAVTHLEDALMRARLATGRMEAL